MKDLTQHILEAIQRDLAYVKHKVDKIDGVEGRLDGLESRFDKLDDGLEALTEYVHVGFEAVIQQNDRRYLDHERRIRLLEARSPTGRKRRPFMPRRPR